MIQIIEKATAPIPIVLQNKGTAATNALIARYDRGDVEFLSTDFDSAIYGHADVKRALQVAQGNKCCFCESKIGHISYGDVEHYRPKTGWVQADEPLNKPGYYWLANDWENLLLSCQICNQRYKKNYFPLRDNNTRALSHTADIHAEDPLFIHPVLDDPELYITFREEVPIAIDSNDRGLATIEKLGLNRELLNEQRRKDLKQLKQLYTIARGIPDTTPEIKNEAKEYITDSYNESLRDDTEYAAMKRAFFRNHPIDF